jgi:hypothetical protein
MFGWLRDESSKKKISEMTMLWQRLFSQRYFCEAFFHNNSEATMGDFSMATRMRRTFRYPDDDEDNQETRDELDEEGGKLSTSSNPENKDHSAN